MRRVLPFNLALASMFLAACVTINVYFPAAAAEKAADRVIENVTGAGTTAAPTTPPQSFVPAETGAPQFTEPNALVVALSTVLNAVIPAAQAQAVIAMARSAMRSRADNFCVSDLSCPQAARMSRPRGVRTGEA